MQTRLLLPDALVLDHGIALGRGVIVGPGPTGAAVILDIVGAEQGRSEHPSVEELPLDGILLPGAIDLQVNGMGGRSVDEGTPPALDAVAEAVWRGGAAAFLPTLITAPFDTLLEQVAAVASWINERQDGADGAIPLGIHVEGPFLELAGAHDENHFVDPTPDRLRALCDAARGTLALVTLAPGRPGAAEAVAQLSAQGVAVALGHGRSVDGFEACVQAGATLVTHLFNAMGPLHHRDPGLAGRALDTQALSCPLIVDGAHIDPLMVRLAYRLLGPRRFVLVTDAMPAAGLGDGAYSFGAIHTEVRDGIARDPHGNLAGSTLTIGRAMANLLQFAPQVGPWSLAQVASTNPARLLQQPQWGALRPGAMARFALLAANGTVTALR